MEALRKFLCLKCDTKIETKNEIQIRASLEFLERIDHF